MGINDTLKAISKLKGFENSKEKGDAGEDAAIILIKDIIKSIPGEKALFQSVVYRLMCDKDGNELPGNLTLTAGRLEPNVSNGTGEIDVLLLTEYHIFIIEVKTYNAYILVDDDWTYKGTNPKQLDPLKFCNLQQVEKSARHFYQQYIDMIPRGDHNYIKPVLVYSQGKLEVKTKDYDVTLLNGLREVILSKEPLSNRLNVKKLERLVEERAISFKKV